jgi:hypothetical protein
MLVGYNTNISYKGSIYHIQTEDSGTSNPVIVTLLYAKGAILASKKTSYAQILQDPELQEKVRKIMKAQHKGMIKDLLAGKYTGDLKDEEDVKAEVETQKEIQEEAKVKGKTKPQITKSLDDILLNYIMKRGK